MLSMRIIITGKEKLIAICDHDILGKKFEEDELELRVNKEFYGGEIVDDARAREALKTATIANLVGANAVSIGVDTGLINPENIIRINGTPHAQYTRL